MKKIREALQFVSEHVPFFNAGDLLDYEGVRYPTGMGGTCILQARTLQEQLRRADIQSRILKALNTGSPRTGHRTVVAFHDERVHLLDPTLNQADPIDLTRVLTTKIPTIFCADVDRGASGREHIVSPTEDNYSNTSFYLEDYYDPYNTGEPEIMSRNMYDIEIEDTTIHAPLSPVEKKRINLIVTDPETKEKLGICMHVQGQIMTAHIMGKNRFAYATPQFDRILRRMAEITNTSIEDIIGTLRLTQTIYARMNATAQKASDVIEYIPE